MRATCTVHFILFHLIIIYKLCSHSLYSFFQVRAISSLAGPNVLLNKFANTFPSICFAAIQTTDKIIVFSIQAADESLWSGDSKQCNLLLISPFIIYWFIAVVTSCLNSWHIFILGECILLRMWYLTSIQRVRHASFLFSYCTKKESSKDIFSIFFITKGTHLKLWFTSF
jgi:hypothetical protein